MSSEEQQHHLYGCHFSFFNMFVYDTVCVRGGEEKKETGYYIYVDANHGNEDYKKMMKTSEL